MPRQIESPIDDALGPWVKRDILLGHKQYDASEITKSLSKEKLYDMVLRLEESIFAELTLWPNTLLWDLPAISQDKAAAYVPPGSRLQERMTHAALFADHLLVNPPTLPPYLVRCAVGLSPVTPSDVIRHSRQQAHELGPNAFAESSTSPPSDVESTLGDDFWESFDEMEGEADEDYARLAQELDLTIGDVADSLLRYALAVRQPLAEGWLHIVGGGLLSTDNMKDIARDPDFRVAYDKWHADLRSSQFEPWGELMVATGLAHSIGRAHIMTLPGSEASRDLISLVSRYYTDLPYGGVMIGRWLPTKRVSLPGSGPLVRGQWFDELLVGLAPALRYVDMPTICKLREAGIADSLSHWLTNDLNQIAFVDNVGEDATIALRTCQERLYRIATNAEAALIQSHSATFRARLRKAGIEGSIGGTGAFVGTMASGTSLPAALTAAGIGFAIGVATGAATEDQAVPASAEAVLIDILQRTPPGPKVQLSR
jgi:hypothetical protein